MCRGRDDGAAEEHGLDGFDATMNRHMLSPASSPYLHPPKTAPAGRSQGRGGGGSKVEEDKQSSIRPGTSASNDQVRLNKLLQTYGKTSTPTHRPSPSSVPTYQGPAQSQRVPAYHGPAQNQRVAGSRQQPAASPSRMPVASTLPRQTALAAPKARPDSAVGSDRPQSGNLRLSADLLAAWGNQCAISTPRPEAAAAGATRPQSGMRGLAVDVSPENSPSALHTAAAAATVGVRNQQQLGMSVTSRPISARPGSARGGAVQQASMTTPLMRSSGSFSRDNFDILDVSDDDRLDGEEPLLEERAGGQPVHTRMVTTYGMTLDQYMSRMVTTPASAASTSGLGTPVGNRKDSRSAYNTAQYQPVIDRGDITVLDSLVSDNAPHPGAAHGGQHGGQHGRPGSALGKPRSAAPRPATSSRRGSAEYGASMWQEVASFEGQAGIASAIQNSLDLRPATAAAPNFTPGGSSSSGGPHRQHRYGSSLMHEHVVGDHGDLIKETDLGGLSASLFMPNAERLRGLNSAAISSKGDSPHAQPAPPALHGSSTAASGRLSNATSSGSELASGPSGRLLNLVSSVNASAAADPTIKANNAPASSEFQRVFPSSNKLPGGTINPGAATSPRAAAAAPSRVLHPKAGQGVLQAQHEDGEVDPLTAAPQQRMVQSARPVTRGGSELDASVWQNTIAVQLERPPSRQKPPAEALHLWAPGEGLSGMQDVMQLGPHSRARSRPQTAAASTYRAKPGQRAQATSGLPQHSTARPPSRQKPPPVSLRHQHEFCSEEMMKPMEAPSEEEYELSEFSDSSDI
ncbi:hypothetical protein CEUSTIGMA_g1350.t1 [Chlamydomonas eustigma]|uniref:Uncharacterized protein n=1 Tax=Chlamydomonas eustigma TaxID=1157962 RepID=A0A250WTN9_9CHLO|nr:hypothetical protein CEUSTIGMA_g1350.t1 [Chlamydomonas eustigma]|eukprot:GAX73900.1 hypothetical protein CEUSTIGMA_g1350.t1 [Chlamydomonas eustigma]